MEKEVSMETNTASPFPYVRDFGQVISATVEFIRQHISSLYKILLNCFEKMLKSSEISKEKSIKIFCVLTEYSIKTNLIIDL